MLASKAATPHAWMLVCLAWGPWVEVPVSLGVSGVLGLWGVRGVAAACGAGSGGRKQREVRTRR